MLTILFTWNTFLRSKNKQLWNSSSNSKIWDYWVIYLFGVFLIKWCVISKINWEVRTWTSLCYGIRIVNQLSRWIALEVCLYFRVLLQFLSTFINFFCDIRTEHVYGMEVAQTWNRKEVLMKFYSNEVAWLLIRIHLVRECS